MRVYLLSIGWLGWLTKPTTLHFISSLSLNLDANTQKLHLPKQWQVISGKAQKAPLDLQDFTGMIISKCDVPLKNEKAKELTKNGKTKFIKSINRA